MVEERTKPMFVVDNCQGPGEIRQLFAGHGWDLVFIGNNKNLDLYNFSTIRAFLALPIMEPMGNKSPSCELYRGCDGLTIALKRSFKNEEEQKLIHDYETKQNEATDGETKLYYEYLIRNHYGYPFPVRDEDLKEYCALSIEASKKGLFNGKKRKEAQQKMSVMEDKLKGTRQYYLSRYCYLKQDAEGIYLFAFDFDLGREPWSLYHAKPLPGINISNYFARAALPLKREYIKEIPEDYLDNIKVKKPKPETNPVGDGLPL